MNELKIGIPDGISAEDVERAACEYREGAEHDFRQSTSYDVLIDGERYPPKAIVGLAASRIAGRVLSNREFSGGKGSKCFRVLEGLGFQVVSKEAGVVSASEIDAFDTVVEGFVPDPETRNRLLEFIAQAIQTAHDESPASWSLTLEKNKKYLNLNVGKIFTFSLYPDHVSFVVPVTLVEKRPELFAGWGASDKEFGSLPGVTWFDAPHEGLTNDWSQISDSFLDVVQRAVAVVSVSPYQKSHSDAAVLYIERELEIELPRPLYPLDEGSNAPHLWVVRSGKEAQANEQFVDRSLKSAWHALAYL